MAHHMPRVVAMLKRRREAGEGALINECWRRGVLEQQPGWFFAAEGGVSVGVPADGLLADPTLLAMREEFGDPALLLLKGQEVTDGAA